VGQEQEEGWEGVKAEAVVEVQVREANVFVLPVDIQCLISPEFLVLR